MRILILLVLILVSLSPAYSVTRFYLPSTGAADVSPAYSAHWEFTPVADRKKTTITKNNSAWEYKDITYMAQGRDSLSRQYVSDPIAAQTISGTIKGALSAQADLAIWGYSCANIYVVSNDGGTVRGTLISMVRGGRYMGSAGTYYTVFTPPLTNVTQVVAQNNDRIVIEIGVAQDAWTGGYGKQVFGASTSSGDLTYTEYSVETKNPWVEFSQDIIFGGASPSGQVIVID